MADLCRFRRAALLAVRFLDALGGQHMGSADGTKRDWWPDALADESVCDRFEAACLAYCGGRAGSAWPQIEDFLGTHDAALRSPLLLKLLTIELDYRLQASESPVLEEYLVRFPADGDSVREAFRAMQDQPAAERVPAGHRLGVYTVRGLLGQGGMGAVYRAWDERRQQEVALKLIRADRLAGSSPAIRRRWVEQFLREAQAASRWQHPAVVPLLDFGQIEGQPYLAMQLIEGRNLRDLQAAGRVPVARAVEIILTIAEALDGLHQHDIYHCDVKPSNILIDGGGRPYLSDFGLALAEEQIPAEPGLAGTAAYMSPEQARGEGHLVDGRSDIFSLAVVLYELLGGENPFEQPDRQKTLELVRHARVVPLRRKHPEIPEELDRICLRALSRRAADRYLTARDFAQDLRAFLDEFDEPGPADADADAGAPLPRIDLQGIAPFGPEDARSYPRLVPGQRTRAGLPVSIAAWLEGIETTVPRRAFRVGLIYGPSGSGKSSLVRAGILPRLSDRVAAVYVDGSCGVETALRLRLSSLIRVVRGSPDPAPDPTDRSQTTDQSSESGRPTVGGFGEVGRPAPSAPRECDPAPESHSLTDLMAAARRSREAGGGETPAKLLIVIDHFEHWLQAHPQPAEAELTAALRQCDGVGVQCLLLVREEFRTPAARFLKELDLEAAPALKESLVDLFDADHARRVLLAMGRSGESLPAADEALTDEHGRFLDAAVRLLEHDGRVVPAQLAMFVEYMRDKPWNAASLTALGGGDSLMAAFFDDVLRRAVGPSPSRHALDVVAATLQDLLPKAHAEYERAVRDGDQLLAASQARNPHEFQSLLDSLCATRIVTGAEPSHATASHVAASLRDADAGLGETGLRERRYQLAHDSLLPLVRAWLQARQRDRWWGRHAQRMTEHALTWSRRPRSALLPSPWDWAVQLLADFCRSFRRSSPPPPPLHRRMMRAATVYYVRAAAVLLLLATAIVGPLVWYLERHHRVTQRIVTEILHADPQRLPAVIRGSSGATSAVQQRLRQELSATAPRDATALARDAAAERAANAAVALCLADPHNASRVWPLLADAPDPRLRTALIHHLAQAAVDPQLLIRGLQENRDPGVRQALLLTLGLYAKDRVPAAIRDSLVSRLQADYRTDPDSGIHAAIHWLLRRWDHGKELDVMNRELEKAGWNPAHNWYHAPAGHLMIVIRGPVEFDMGSPANEYGRQENETRKRVRIAWTFAISATEVTEFQYNTCHGKPYAPRDPKRPEDHYPVNDNIYWNDAAWYCRELTLHEIQGSDRRFAYVPARHSSGRIIHDWYGIVHCRYAPRSLESRGYRLPTEAEWEYACRAGTTTSRFFGESELYLDSYAWSYDTTTGKASPVASLMPNRLGLFDILGNLSEWTHDVYAEHGEDRAMSLRGGSAWSSPVKLRAAHRSFFSFTHTDHRLGFRIARTLQ